MENMMERNGLVSIDAEIGEETAAKIDEIAMETGTTFEEVCSWLVSKGAGEVSSGVGV